MQACSGLRKKLHNQHREGAMKAHYTAKYLFLSVLVLGALLLCLAPPAVQAEEQVKHAISTDGDTDTVLAEELMKLRGGWVSITLNSGSTFSGTVQKVRSGLVHLSQIQGKEYYEALIRIEDISALGARFRSKKKNKE
jgi:hypothetical protein